MKYLLVSLVALFTLLITFGCNEMSSNGSSTQEQRIDVSVGDVSAYSLETTSDQNYSTDLLFEKEEFAYSSNPITGQKAYTKSPAVSQSVLEATESQTMIIKNGNMTIEVNDLAIGKSKLDSVLSKHNGHYQSENYNKGYNQSSYSLVLRIPIKEWDNMLTGISDGIGIVKDKSVNATDVTEEYTDLALRLENNEAYLKRYLKLLDKADSIKDMITIQEKVRHIEEEIESKKGRMKYLRNKVSYSTLSLQLVAYHPALANADDRHFGHEIASAFINGYNGLLGFVLILAGMWPFLLIVGGCVWFGKRFWGRRIAGRKEVVA